MDLNKEIKLSDLVRRPKKKKTAGVRSRAARSASGGGSRRSSVSRSAPPRSRPRGSSTTAARAKLVQLARVPLEPGIVVGGEVRDVPALAAALDELLHATHKLPRRGIRLGIAHEPHRRARVRASTASTTSASSRTRSASARTRRSRSRSTRRCSTTTSSAETRRRVRGSVSRRVVLAAAYREPIDHYVEACKEAGIEVAGVDLEAFALLRAVAPRADGATAGRRRRGDDRSRPHDAGDLRRHRLRLHARPRLGRREARGRDRAASSALSAAEAARAEARARPRRRRIGGDDPRARARPRRVSPASCRRSRVS